MVSKSFGNQKAQTQRLCPLIAANSPFEELGLLKT
jgi:hypothetical protein